MNHMRIVIAYMFWSSLLDTDAPTSGKGLLDKDAPTSATRLFSSMTASILRGEKDNGL